MPLPLPKQLPFMDSRLPPMDFTGVSSDEDDTPPSSLGFRLKVELVLLGLLTGLTLLQLVFKGAFLAVMAPALAYITFIIAASAGAVVPGLIYKGGEWYLKVVRREHFQSRERAFVVFLLETGFAVIVAVAVQQFLLVLFPRFLQYVWLVFLEWFLLLYIWFTRVKRYPFPWFYAIATNLLMAAFAYIIYRNM